MKTLTDSKNMKLGVILSYGAMLLSMLGALFVTNRILNLIGDYNYGLYAFVCSITAWLTVVVSALNASFLRYTTMEANEKNGDVSRTNTMYLKLLVICGAVVLFVGLSIIAGLYFTHTNFTKYNWHDSCIIYGLFALSIFNIALTMPANIFGLFLNYKKQFVFIQCLSIVTTVINFAGHFIIAYFTKSIVLICTFTIFSTLFSTSINAIYCKKRLNIRFSRVKLRENRILVSSIIVFSSIVLFNAIVDQINSGVDKTLLGLFSTPMDVTLYQLGQQFNIYMVTMSLAVSGVFSPTIHKLCIDNSYEKLSDLYYRISKIQIILLCMLTFGFCSCGEDFVKWWIGPERVTAFVVGAVLMLIDLCPLTMNSSIEIQRAQNKHKFRALIYFLLALVNVILSVAFLYILPSEYAIYACLLGSVIARIGSHWISMNIYNQKKMHLPVWKYMMTLFKYMGVGAVCTGAVLLFKMFILTGIESSLVKFICEGILFVVFYGAFVLIFDRETVMGVIKRKFD